MMSLKRLSLALAMAAALALPAHAATFGTAGFWFTDGSRKTVVLDIRHVGEVTISRAVHPIPASCRDWEVAAIRDNVFSEDFAYTPVQGYFALRDALSRAENRGRNRVHVSIEACSFDKLVVCFSGATGKVCGVAQSGYSRW